MALPYREGLYRSQDDLALYYRDYGEPGAGRTTILCLAGLVRNSSDYHRFASRHAPEHRVVCPDYRGRGRSQRDPNWRNYRPETYLGDLRHLLAALNLHRVVLVGTSLGGILSMALGVLLPTVIAGAVINDVGPEIDNNGLDRILDYIGTDRPQPDWPHAIAHFKTMFPALGLESDAAWQSMAEGTYRKGADGLLHFDWDLAIAKPLRKSGGRVPDLWPLFRSLRRRPVLLLRGALSDVLSAATVERMVRDKPDLECVTVPRVGHAPSLDEPACREAIDRFLAQL